MTRTRDKAADSVGADEPRYRIGMVAKKTGIAAHTLRAWERRYGSLTPGRMAGGGRLYSEEDVARLALLKQLTDHGHAIGSIAGRPSEELVRMLSEARKPDERTLPLDRLAVEIMRERFLAAVVAFDVNAAARVLAHAGLVMTPREFVCNLLAPLFHEIGERWGRGELSIAHEHAASNLLRTELGALLRSATSLQNGRTLVAATLSGEQHEFGALLASLLAAAHGHRVIYLGANLPVQDIVRAVREARAQLVLISIVNQEIANCCTELKQLREALPQSVAVCVGGRAALRCKKILAGPGFQYVGSLEELEAVLAL